MPVADHSSLPVAVSPDSPPAPDVSAEITVLASNIVRFANVGTAGSPVISWTTDTEPAIACFTLERSPDSRNWHSMHLLAAVGSTDRGATYRVPVQEATGGEQAYRLRQTSLDGSATFSEILALTPPCVAARRVSASLDSAGNVLQLSLSDPQPAALQLRCGLGRTVAQAIVQGATAVLDLKAVPRGIYFLTVAQAGMEEILRVVKE